MYNMKKIMYVWFILILVTFSSGALITIESKDKMLTNSHLSREIKINEGMNEECVLTFDNKKEFYKEYTCKYIKKIYYPDPNIKGTGEGTVMYDCKGRVDELPKDCADGLSAVNKDGIQTRCYYNDKSNWYFCAVGWVAVP